jgi:hypothetical protein
MLKLLMDGSVKSEEWTIYQYCKYCGKSAEIGVSLYLHAVYDLEKLFEFVFHYRVYIIQEQFPIENIIISWSKKPSLFSQSCMMSWSTAFVAVIQMVLQQLIVLSVRRS